MKQFDRMVRILKNPRIELEKVKIEQIKMKEILIYMGFLALISASTYTIGMAVGINIGNPEKSNYPLELAVRGGILNYVLVFSAFVASGILINSIVPIFGSKRNLSQVLKLIAYSGTPGLVGSISTVVPDLGFIGLIFGLYGVYILYMGSSILMETPTINKTVALTIISMAILIASEVIFDAILGKVMLGEVTPMFQFHPD